MTPIPTSNSPDVLLIGAGIMSASLAVLLKELDPNLKIELHEVLEPDLIRDFSHLSVFIGAGGLDPIVPSGQVEELAAIFESGGADVAISWRQGGHELADDDIHAAKTWLSKEKVRKKVAA